MTDIWFISDTHFGHENILKFKKNDGTPLRAFSSIDEHDWTIINNWNKLVKPQDKAYILGDIVINKKHLLKLKSMNGHLRLVRGNHDIEDTKVWMEYFEEIYGVRVFSKEGFVCSHIPIHKECMSRWKVNVHGHLHGNTLPDKQYMSVCCEQVNYTPVHMDEILTYIRKLK